MSLTRLIRATCVGAFLLLGACQAAPPETRAVVAFDAELQLQPDGSVLVREQLRLPPGPQPPSLTRRLTTLRHEGISDVSATAEDPQVVYNGRVESTAEGTRVTWDFGPVPARRLTLTYRANDVTYVSGMRGRVSFQILPPNHGLAIEHATVTLSYPERSIVMADPWIEEAGWEVESAVPGVRARRASVPPETPLTIGGEFSIDGFNLAAPAWQYQGARAKEFMPAFVSAGLFLVVTAAGIVGMVRLRHPRRLPVEADPERPAVARGLSVSGLVTIAAAIAGVPLVARTLPTYGVWPYCIPAGTFVAGVMFLWMGRRLRTEEPPSRGTSAPRHPGTP